MNCTVAWCLRDSWASTAMNSRLSFRRTSAASRATAACALATSVRVDGGRGRRGRRHGRRGGRQPPGPADSSIRRAPLKPCEKYGSSRLEIFTTSPVLGAWMNLSPPSDMPTWCGESASPKKTRSPGFSSERSTSVPTSTWSKVTRGSWMPAWA